MHSFYSQSSLYLHKPTWTNASVNERRCYFCTVFSRRLRPIVGYMQYFAHYLIWQIDRNGTVSDPFLLIWFTFLWFHIIYSFEVFVRYSTNVNLPVWRSSCQNSGISSATICHITNAYCRFVFMMINTDMHIWSRAGHSIVLSFGLLFDLCI